jgi:hypothetical protein
VVRPDGTLIAGARRLAACRDVLGLAEVPVRVIDIEALVRGEADENAQRLGFSPEEAVEVYNAVLKEEREQARERQKAGLRRGREKAPAEEASVQENLLNGTKLQSRDLAANVTGYSWRSLDMAGEVVGHAVEEPDTFQPIREEMNRSRNIGKAHAAVRRIERERAMAKQRTPGSGRLGLLHPIVVRRDGMLIAGARRLAACRDVLGLAEVPVRVMDIPLPVRGEAEENAQRLGFAPEEAVNIFDALIEEERGLARRRLSEAGKRGGIESGKSRRGEREEAKPPGISRRVQDQEIRGESREVAANVTGYSEKSLRMARFVVEHAEVEPDTFDEIRQEMNRTRNIARAVPQS